MHALRCVVAVVLVLGVAAGASAEHHEKKQSLLDELTEIGDQLSVAMVENDVETLLGMYAEDAISLPNYGPRMEGMDAFRKSNEMMTAAGMKVLSFESEPTEAWQAGDQVIEIGTFAIALEMPGMGKVEDRGKYLTIYERDAEGALKIKVETWNTDMMPMGMMGGQSGEPAAAKEGEPAANEGEQMDADKVP